MRRAPTWKLVTHGCYGVWGLSDVTKTNKKEKRYFAALKQIKKKKDILLHCASTTGKIECKLKIKFTYF